MPDHALTQAIAAALTTTHRHLALAHGQALRYPAAVAPFAAVASGSPGALDDLRQLLQPGETVYLQGARPPDTPGLLSEGVVPCLQMVFPPATALPQSRPGIALEPLDCRHAPEMVELIAVAYPGYFRPETCRMGRYFGVRDPGGKLVAMGGERLCLDPWHEISGLCTHPEHTGGGYGTAILRQLLTYHREAGLRSWLWVTEANRKAIDLYLRLGFVTNAHSRLQRLTRVAD